MSQLAENIRVLMASRGIPSENKLAELIASPDDEKKGTAVQSTINRIMRGETADPRDSTIQPIADFFGVTVHSLKTSNFAYGKGAIGATRATDLPGARMMDATNSRNVRPDPTILRNAVVAAERIIASRGATNLISPEGRAEIVLALYDIQAEGVGMEQAARMADGMLNALLQSVLTGGLKAR